MTQAQTDFLLSRIVERCTARLSEDFCLPLDSAFSAVYSSKIYKGLEDSRCGLLSQSADYVYEKLEREYRSNDGNNEDEALHRYTL